MLLALNTLAKTKVFERLNKRMNFSIKSLVTVLYVASVLCLPSQTLAEENTTLSTIKSKIQSLRSKINSKQDERDIILESIKERDFEINALLQRIKATQNERAEINLNISNLKEKQVRLHKQKQTLQSGLMTQLEAAYKTGKQSRVKMLLNQKKPETIGRLLAYHNYLHIAREEKINSLQNAIEALKDLEEDIDKQTWQLSLNEEKLRRERSLLTKSKVQKKHLLTKVNKEIKLSARDLQGLINEQQRIRNLVSKLSKESRQQPTPVNNSAIGTFVGNKSKLLRPVLGNVKHRYNSIISGNIRRAGIFIKSNEGNSVRAIFDGKVVYSDEFPKKGLMTIISHGDGYMSLYAHNKVLFRNVGDTVKAGDKIALVGDSGSANSTGLYFEIRRNGKPVNPSSWLSK